MDWGWEKIRTEWRNIQNQQKKVQVFHDQWQIKKNDNKNGKTMSKGHLFEGAQAFEAEAADQFLRLVGRFAVPGAH